MKYCCGITTYYPEASDVNCVLGLTAAFSKVYIYDNTPGGIDSCLKQKLLDDPKIVFFSNGENDGLSIAYQCFHEVAKCKYDYLCLLDQDSRLTNKDISKIINSIEEDSDNSVAIYAPRIQYQHSKQLSPSNRVDIVDWVISSGSFIKIDFLNTISGFDNYYFIDRIDQDLCLCFRKKNKKIKIINSVTLLQDLGEIKNIFGLKFFQHNEFRNYHIARNRYISTESIKKSIPYRT